jgi:hypothetical protein
VTRGRDPDSAFTPALTPTFGTEIVRIDDDLVE